MPFPVISSASESLPTFSFRESQLSPKPSTNADKRNVLDNRRRKHDHHQRETVQTISIKPELLTRI
jgi:hypothetical protein